MQTTQPAPPIVKTPLVTFIVTYYNLQPQLLDECLDSILSLSLEKDEREIIVVDDGSTISPLEVIQSKLDDIVYIRQRNSGLSTARNLGIEASKGKYIQFVDKFPMNGAGKILKYKMREDAIKLLGLEKASSTETA